MPFSIKFHRKMLFVGHCVWVGEFIAVSNCPCKKIKLLQKYLVISLIFLLLYDRIEMWCFCWVNHISCFCCCKQISSGNNLQYYQDYTGRLSNNFSNSTRYLYTADSSCKRHFLSRKLHKNILFHDICKSLGQLLTYVHILFQYLKAIVTN